MRKNDLSKRTFIGISSFLLVAMPMIFLAQSSRGEPRPVPDDRADAGVAVVELFTSEGCSSCPPAEELLNAIADEARAKGQRVYPIAFHVDYWNRLGWTDPFSTPAATERQRKYAKALKLDGIYTPQMIVNGKAEFVGSDKTRASTEIGKALKAGQPTPVKLEVVDAKSGTITVKFEVVHATADAVLTLVAVRKTATSVVRRGENAGRTLRHVNVAIGMQSTPLLKGRSGQATLNVPADEDLQAMEIVGFVQSPSLLITGGTSISAALRR